MSSVSSLNSLLSSASTSSNSATNLSSILAAATGSSTSAIDVTGAVNAAIYAAQAPERQWQTQQSAVQSQITALNSVQTSLSTLSSDLDGLNNAKGSLAARTVSSSDSSVVTATASAGASVGNHIITVDQLATSASWYSAAVPSSSSSLGSSTLTITNSAGTPTTFNVGSGSATSLSSLASSINAASLGIAASVVNDANGSRLALVSTTSGSSANFTVSESDSTFGFTQASAGANASLHIDGIPVSSATNTVSGALPGVTLNLQGVSGGAQGASSSAQVILGVSADNSQISASVSQFVTDYNSAISLVNSQFTFNAATNSQGALGSDATVRSLQSMLLGVPGYTAGSGSSSSSSAPSASTLADLGITMQNDGTLTLNSAQLNQSVAANPSVVQNFFQGNAFNGFASNLQTQLTSFIDPLKGSLGVDVKQLSQQYTDLQTNVDNYESGYIASQRTVLTAMYSKAEIALQQLPTTMKQLQAQLGNNSGN